MHQSALMPHIATSFGNKDAPPTLATECFHLQHDRMFCRWDAVMLRAPFKQTVQRDKMEATRERWASEIEAMQVA